MSSDNSSIQLQLEELRRHIDYQVEENARLEKHAHNILRIVLSVTGLLITAIVGITSTGLLFRYGSPVQLESFVNQLAEEWFFLNEGLAILVIIILLFSAIGLFFASIYHLFILSLTHAYRVLAISVFQPGLAISDVGSIQTAERDRLVDEYRGIIQTNERILEDTRKNWQECHTSLGRGGGFFALSILVYLPFAMGSASYAGLIFALEVIWGIYFLGKYLNEWHINYILVGSAILEVGGVIFYIIYVDSIISSFNSEFIPVLAAIYTFIVIPGYLLLIPLKHHIRHLVRYSVIAACLFALTSVVLLSEIGRFYISPNIIIYPVDILVGFASVTIVIAVILFIFVFVRIPIYLLADVATRE